MESSLIRLIMRSSLQNWKYKGAKALKRTKRNGIILRRAVETEARVQNRLLLSGLAMLLAGAWIGTLGGEVGLWEMTAPWPAFLAAAAVCAIWSAMSFWRKERFFLIVALGLLLILLALFGGRITDGACLLWNQISDTYTAGTGKILLELQVMAETEAYKRCVSLCLLLTGSLVGLAAIFCVQRGAIATAIVSPAALLAVMLLFRQSHAGGWHVFLLAVCVLLLLSGGWELRRKGQFWPVAGGAVCGLLVCGLLSALLLLPGAEYWAENAAIWAAEKLHRLQYETEHTALPEGRLANYESDDQPGYTALLVTMDQPEALYLRGFVGEVYGDDNWMQTPPEDLAAQKELLYWLQKHAFYSQTQFDAAAQGLEAETNRITVQNVNACSKYAYVPYALVKNGAGLLDPEYLQPGAVDANGSRSYSYRSLYASHDSLQEILTLLQEDTGETVLSYRQAESGYRDYVYAQMLQVPDSVIDQLGPALDACCAEYGSAAELTIGQAQDSALEFLSLYFGSQSEEMAPFLPHLQGTHYRYATVAALALRYYGVPARYAEGFLIPEELAAEGGQIPVDNSCARAWVEVYQDGVGWLPLELTPGFEALAGKETEAGVRPVGVDGINPNAETGSETGEGEGSPLAEGREKDRDEAEQDDTDGILSSGGTVVLIRKALKWMGLLIILGIILLLAAIIFRRVYLLHQKKKRFASEDRADAICWLYADAAEMLSAMGLRRNGGSMEMVCRQAETVLGEEYARMCAQMTALNGEALFSNHQMEEDCRGAMAEFREKTLEQLKQQVKWYQKLWLQWGLCLY